MIRTVPKDLQEWLDRIYTASKTGKFPAGDYDPDEDFVECQYRYKRDSGEVVACPVGLAIPDRRYSPKCENMGAQFLPEHFPDRCPGIVKNNLSLAREIQRLHDEFAAEGKWQHGRFMRAVLKLDGFRGLKPKLTADNS